MHSILSKCDNCEGLDTLYKKIECTILFMVKKKHAILIYNLDEKFDSLRLESLIRYKRIIGKRMRDCNYPASHVKNSQLISIVSRLAFKGENCSECETCFPDL